MISELSLSPATGLPSPVAARSSNSPPLRLPGTAGDAPAADGDRLPHAVAVAQDVLSRAAQRVADSLGGGNSFNFSVDTKTGMTIVKVINRASGELVRQIPSEEVVRIAELLQQDEHHSVYDVRV